MPETKKPMHPLNLPPTGTPGNGDSIKPKVFGKGGMGFGEGREKLFFRKVFPPYPNLSQLFPYSTALPILFRRMLLRPSADQ